MWRKRNRKIIIYYLSRKKHSLLTLSRNGKAILTFRMTIWEIFFCFFILLRLNLMLRLSSIKGFKIYFIQIKNYSDSVSEQIMCVLFVRLNEKLYTISFTQGDFGTVFESYWCLLSNQQVRLSLQNFIFGIISKQCPSTKLINYFIVVGKLFLSDCRRNQI